MSLKEEIAECPATYGLAGSWIVVYAVMLASQSAGPHPEGMPIMGLGLLRAETIRLWGAVTWRDFAGGEPWRAVTATFIHVNLPHLAMNLIGLIQLGRLIEPWYGGRIFLAICIGLGGIGNTLGVGMRHGLASGRDWLQAKGLARVLPGFLTEGTTAITENTPAAGGSTVILGLIGLGLIVGWRSRTRVGAFLRDQMLGFLAFTAVLGFLGRQFVDNYGHAGGAIAGTVCGFLHRRLIRAADRRRVRRVAGVAVAGLVVACAGFQAVAARSELAEARRMAGVREALAFANEAEGLVERLKVVGVLFDQVVAEQFRLELERALLAGDPSATSALDPSAAFPLSTRGLAPARGEEGSPPRLNEMLRTWIANLSAFSGRLEPSLLGDDFEEVVRLGSEALSGPLGSREVYRFRTARHAVERRAASVRDGWLHRRDELERGGSGRRAAGERVPVAVPRAAIPALDRRDKVGHRTDRAGELGVITANHLGFVGVARTGSAHC